MNDMKYVITEDQNRSIKENEYNIRLRRRHLIIEQWIMETLPMLEPEYYEDENDFIDSVITLFIDYISDYSETFPYFLGIPRRVVRKYLRDNFRELITNFYNES